MVQLYCISAPYNRVLPVPEGLASEIEQADVGNAVTVVHKAKCGGCSGGVRRYCWVDAGWVQPDGHDMAELVITCEAGLPDAIVNHPGIVIRRQIRVIVLV